MKQYGKPKAQLNLTVDVDTIKYHRAKGTNISQVVGEYLKGLMGDQVEEISLDSRINELEADLAKTKLQKQQYELTLQQKANELKKEEFKECINDLAQLNKRRLSSKIAEKDFLEKFEWFIKQYGLNRGDALAYIEGRRRLE